MEHPLQAIRKTAMSFLKLIATKLIPEEIMKIKFGVNSVLAI